MDIREIAAAACREVRDFKLPHWDELPDIELYMDQVIILMGKYTGSEGEKLLTPSMVNNYVKMGIMPAPIKKHYSRRHLAYLIIICVLKQVMPIQLIADFIESSLTELSEQLLLDTFCDYYSVAAEEAAENVMHRIEIIESEGKTGVNLLAATCAVRSQIELKIAEKIALKGAEG